MKRGGKSKREKARARANEIKEAGYKYVADSETGTYQLVDNSGKVYKGDFGGVEEGSGIFSKDRRLKRMIGEELAHNYYTSPTSVSTPTGDITQQGNTNVNPTGSTSTGNTQTDNIGVDDTAITTPPPVPPKYSDTVKLAEYLPFEEDEMLDIVDSPTPALRGIDLKSGRWYNETDFGTDFKTPEERDKFYDWAQERYPKLSRREQGYKQGYEGVEPWRAWADTRGYKQYSGIREEEAANEALPALRERAMKELGWTKQQVENLNFESLTQVLGKSAPTEQVRLNPVEAYKQRMIERRQSRKLGGILYKQ